MFGGIYLPCQEAISIEVTHGDNEDDSHATTASVASVSTAMMGRVAAKKVVAPATFARQFVDPARDTVDDSAIARSTISRATLLFKVSESPHKGEKGSMDEEKIVDSAAKAETERNFEGGEQATKHPAHKAHPFPVPYIDDHTKCCALVTVPPGQNGLPQQCRAIILSSASGVCPEGYGSSPDTPLPLHSHVSVRFDVIISLTLFLSCILVPDQSRIGFSFLFITPQAFVCDVCVHVCCLFGMLLRFFNKRQVCAT